MVSHRRCEVNPWLAPLHLAVLTQNIEMTRLLLDGGANIEIEDRNGRTPLFFAVDGRMVSLLLDAGADPLHSASGDYRNPLVAYLEGPIFWRSGDPEPAQSLDAFRRMLVAARGKASDWNKTINATLSRSRQPGRLLLQMAVQKEVSYARLLLDMGADPNKHSTSPRAPDEPMVNGLSPLMQAAESSGPDVMEVVKLLVARGAHVDHFSGTEYTDYTQGYTALTKAIQYGRYDLVKWLVTDAGADPNLAYGRPSSMQFPRPSPRPWFPICHAIKHGDAPMLELLIKLGADVRRAVTGDLLGALVGLRCRADSRVWTSILPRDRDLLVKMARILVQNGADLYHNSPRTTYYLRNVAFIVGHEEQGKVSPQKLLAYNTNFRWFFKDYDSEHLGVDTSRHQYEPAIGRVVCHVHSGTSMDPKAKPTKALYNNIYRSLGYYGTCSGEWSTYKYHRSWTTLHTAMVHGSRESVKAILSCGADPHCHLRLQPQMRNTPLGALIKTGNFYHVRGCKDGHQHPGGCDLAIWNADPCPTPHRPADGIMGPFRELEWDKARLFLRHYGPGVTAAFPRGLLAEFLSQAVARLTTTAAREARVREFAALTDHDGRPWGTDGVSGLRVLLRQPGYWWSLEREAGLVRPPGRPRVPRAGSVFSPRAGHGARVPGGSVAGVGGGRGGVG